MHRSFLEENYLEVIYILQQRNESVRSIDVAEYLSVAKSSVNSAVNKLLTQQYITFEDDKIIRMTAEGEKIAEFVYEKHLYLKKLLCKMGIDETEADEIACLLEHILKEDSFKKIKKFVQDKKII